MNKKFYHSIFLNSNCFPVFDCIFFSCIIMCSLVLPLRTKFTNLTQLRCSCFHLPARRVNAGTQGSRRRRTVLNPFNRVPNVVLSYGGVLPSTTVDLWSTGRSPPGCPCALNGSLPYGSLLPLGLNGRHMPRFEESFDDTGPVSPVS